MANLPTQSFDTIVANTIAGIQGRAKKLIDFSEGSTLRAIAEGFTGVFLWFQGLVLLVLQASRLSTASGVDVDTFTADFMPPIVGTTSPRLGAQAASGQVTFARFTAAPATCFIPVGATVQTNDGQNDFAVIADPTFGTYSQDPNGYTLAANVDSIIVPVQAVVAGSAGNVVAGSITVMTSPITGIDTVTNVASFINGADQESDSALKARFAAYILGLSRGDAFGLQASIEGTAVNVQYTLTEAYNLDGSFHPGYFFVVADDGSGSPSPAFLQMVTDAVNAVRPLSVQAAVFAPTIFIANVSMQIQTALGYDHNTVVSQVVALIGVNIKQLGLGNPLPFSILSAWAYSVPGVTQVGGVLLNGASGDAASVLPTKLTQDGTFVIRYATIKPGIIAVS
ncbi:baseplate J/gp47 family protein [Bradyrhizobium lablabi]|uniref:baseplate J/gp47 family protein n=1 Tax=Bradyrhizobium lablabi TaxID=722472 RepID=UPI001BA4463E|nr:baseplate J/gp47 family protein [Bradyrhizobium lablabi]MBR0693689.1 baseplate J/gp47 family protein [Bradyrhizobium lablabi]